MGVKITKKHIIYALLALAVILSITPWLKDGIPGTDDLRSHVSRFWHIQNSFENGKLSSPWMQELYSGWPVFELYPFLPYLISAPFLLFVGAVTALKYSIILSFIIAAISMFYAAKLLFDDDEISFIAAVAYTFFPYHFIDAGIRGAFGELWAYSFFPLAFVFIIKSFDEPSKKNILAAIGLSAAMILTNISTAYMLWLLIAIYFIYKIISEQKISIKAVKSFAIIAIASLLLIAFWLVPFLAESKYANFGSADYGIYGSMSSQKGLSVNQLFSRQFGYVGNERMDYIGFSLIALVIVSFLYKNKFARFFAITAAFFIAAMLIPFIVNLLPLGRLLQFEFRLSVIIGMSLAFVAGVSAKALLGMLRLNSDKKEKNSKNSASKNLNSSNTKLIILVAIAALIIIDFYPANNFYWVSQKDDYFINNPAQVAVLTAISDEPGNFMVFTPTAQMAYAYHKKFELGFDWEGFREGAVSAIHSNYTTDAFAFINSLQAGKLNDTLKTADRLGYYGVKYIVLPCIPELDKVYAVKYTNNAYCAYENRYFRPLVEIENGTITKTTFNLDAISSQSSSKTDTSVLFKVADFAGHWIAYVDGQKTITNKVFPQFIEVNIPKGNHRIDLKYESTNIQIISRIISGLALIAIIMFAFKKERTSKRK